MSDGGKGSTPRPFSVSQKTYADNYNAIFRKKTPQELDDAKAEAQAKAEADKVAAQAKLTALGLTVDDLKALGL